jgi:hypothetical protein
MALLRRPLVSAFFVAVVHPFGGLSCAYMLRQRALSFCWSLLLVHLGASQTSVKDTHRLQQPEVDSQALWVAGIDVLVNACARKPLPKQHTHCCCEDHLLIPAAATVVCSMFAALHSEYVCSLCVHGSISVTQYCGLGVVAGLCFAAAAAATAATAVVKRPDKLRQGLLKSTEGS